MSYVGVPAGKDPRETGGEGTSERTDGSWNADEFKNRRSAFENRKTVELYEDEGARARGLRELMLPKPPEFGLSFNRPSASSTYGSDKDPVSSPPSQSSSSWTHHVPHPLSDAPVMEGPSHNQPAMTQQRFIDEDDDGLGVSSRPHPQPSTQPPSLPGGGNGNGGSCPPGRQMPSYLHRLDSVEESEREDPGLSQQVELLAAKNRQLQRQLEEREIERDRLREQLETQRVDKGLRFVCSPTGLPSRVLDGRKVLTSPGISTSTPSSPHCPSQSPLPPTSPLRVVSPTVPPLHHHHYHHHHHQHHPRTTSPLPQSPHSRYPMQLVKDGSADTSSNSSSSSNGSSPKRQITDSGYQPRRDTPTSPLSSVTKQYFQQIEELKRDNREMEKRLRELLDEKRRLEIELSQKKESFLKMQAREQDLSKDIELLRDENSHHTSAIKRLQTERDGLKSENETLHDELASLNDKLNKTEKCYKEVEHENLSLEAEIEQLVTDKKLLCDEKQKLQNAVEGALKTKESFRSTIKQLRMDNQSLEDSMRRQPAENGRGASGVGAVGRQKKNSEPATPAQKTLNEVMDLREEKWALQGKLLSTQQEIDSLEAHLKIQEFEEVGKALPISSTSSILEGDWREEIAHHFSSFHSNVSRLKAELESVRSDVSIFSGHQHGLVHESFLILVEKCRELLSKAKNDNTVLSENLQLAELSVSKVMEDFDILKQENLNLLSQRDEMRSEVNRLKGDISTLRDRERMLTTRLTQTETMAQEKEEQLNTLKTEKVEVEERYQSSEKKWKKVMGKLQQDFEDKEAELTQEIELLSEDRDGLLEIKEDLERRLAEVSLENEKLTIICNNFEEQLKQTEDRMQALTDEVGENVHKIEVAQMEMARLLTQKVCLSAQVTIAQEILDIKMAKLEEDKERSIAKSNTEKQALEKNVEDLEVEKRNLLVKLEEISAKERLIGTLESNVAMLKRKQEDMQSEMDMLSKKHSSVEQEFQALEERQHADRLKNEKLKMQLTTEIELLRSKLSTVEGDKNRLETTLSGLRKKEGGEKVKQSAFHVVPGAKQQELVKKHSIGVQQQLGDLKQQQQQQQQRGLQPTLDGSGIFGRMGASKISELQNRLTVLEKENKMLKEIAKKPAPPTSSLGSSSSSYDEEMVLNLRKKITEMTRKIFFLESDKQHLTEKVKSVSANLKAARDTKNRLSNEQTQKLQVENASLHDRVRKLEESLTKKLMAADSKIVETVSENDVLREKLLQIQSSLGSKDSSEDGDSPQEVVEVIWSKLEVLQALKVGWAASLENLDKLESVHQQMEGLQQELQLSFSAGESSTDASSSVSPSLSGSRSSVPVFKSLPAGYLENFQHHPGSPGSSTKSDSKSSSNFGSSCNNSNPEAQKKVSEMTSAAADFGELLKKYKLEMVGREAELTSACESLESLYERFKTEAGRSKSVLSAASVLQGVELEGGRLRGEMKRQIEMLQDQVMVRDSALSDIEMQMKADFEAHHKKFTLVKSQVLELRERMSAMEDQLRSKDQYIHQTEERCIAMENELFKVRKDLDGHLQGQKEFVRQAVTDKMKVQGVNSVADVIRMQREEMSQLQKALRDFSCDLTQAQSQLEATQREKSVLLSKSLELEKMHVQMKEHMGADIHYLRQLNMQLVERQVKADKATEILKEVKAAKNAFNKQKDLMKMESELDAAKIKVLEQNHRIEELESQISSQSLSIKILQAEKEHSIALQHHSPPELSGQISRMHMRPRSAESARRPKYKINAGSDIKSRVGTTGRGLSSEFSIILPSQNARHGNMDILNLEEQPEPGASPLMLSLGPMVVTDDEYTAGHDIEKTSEKTSVKPQRFQRVKKDRHRRTASTGSSIIPCPKEKEGSSGSKFTNASSSKGGKMAAGGSKTLPSRQLQTPLQLSVGMGGTKLGGEGADDGDGTIKRPGSAGSTSRQIFHMRQDSEALLLGDSSKMTPEGFHDYSPTPVDKRMAEESKRGTTTSENRTSTMSDDSSGRGLSKGGVLGSCTGGGTTTETKGKGRYDSGRNKPVNKSTDSNETTSSEGNGFSSKSSSQSDSSAGGNILISPARKTLKRALEHPSLREASIQNTDLSRTESMSSTCSMFSYGGNMPSRNESFTTYDGGEESSTYEGLEIGVGDSVENLQTLGKLGYSPYMPPIAPSETYTTSSSEDESYRKSYRKKSSTNTGDNTPRHRDIAYPGSNSSGESDALGGAGYRDKGGDKPRLSDIPAHVNESISISDMDRDATDIEIEDKAAKLKQCFQDSNLKLGRKRYSSTGSVKICYSESSMEDISKN